MPVSPSLQSGDSQAAETLRERIAAVLARFDTNRSALITLLQAVQQELGYLPGEAFGLIARKLAVSPSEVYGVATFYAQFRMAQSGRNRIMACRGTACHVKGAGRVLRAIKQELGVEEGQTTPDGEFTLETVACIGACALAPTMMINQDTFGKLTPGKAMTSLAERRAKGVS